MCSKVKTRNLLSDFKSAFKSIKGGELTELSKLTQDVRYLTLKRSSLNRKRLLFIMTKGGCPKKKTSKIWTFGKSDVGRVN